MFVCGRDIFLHCLLNQYVKLAKDSGGAENVCFGNSSDPQKFSKSWPIGREWVRRRAQTSLFSLRARGAVT